MKKFISYLLAVVLIISGVITFNNTDIQAATKTGVTLTTSNCSIDNKKVNSYNNVNTIFENIDTLYSSKTNKDTRSITKVKNNSYIQIKANESGILYITIAYNKSALDLDHDIKITGYTDKACKKPIKSYVDNLAFGIGEGNDTNEFTDLDVRSSLHNNNYVSNTHQCILYSGETIYLKPTDDVKVSLEWLPIKNSMNTVDRDTGYVSINVPAKTIDNFVAMYFKNNANTLTTGYTEIRTNMTKGTINTTKSLYQNATNASSIISSVSPNTNSSPISRILNLGYGNSLEGVVFFNISTNKGISYTCVIPFRFSDIRKYDPIWCEENQVTEPLVMSIGSKAIVGILPPTVPSQTIYVQVNSKKYTVKVKNIYNTNYYLVELNSALKLKDSVSLWYDGLESAKVSYKISK